MSITAATSPACILRRLRHRCGSRSSTRRSAGRKAARPQGRKAARPQGRGKIERFFGTINTELLPELAGRLVKGQPASPPALSLSELDAAIAAFIVDVYHARPHSQTDETRGQSVGCHLNNASVTGLSVSIPF
jgi:transposase InsO family protein